MSEINHPINSTEKREKKSWLQLKTIVEFSRKLIYSLNGDSPSNVTFHDYVNEQNEAHTRVYFLGGNRKNDITIKYVDIDGQCADKLSGRMLFDEFTNQTVVKHQLTKEEQLLRERKRCSFNGITSFCMDHGRCVFSENSALYYCDDRITQPTEISTVVKGAIDVQICPTNANLISYVLNDNLFIQDLKSKQEIQLTNTSDSVKSAVPSYVVQEEFNRYTGYWWQPTRQTNIDESHTYRIVYEEIDDRDVDLIYVSPSCENEYGVDTYRYPKAGKNNSKIYLKMIEITVLNDVNKSPIIRKKLMYKSFYELFSWYEYLVRADWVPNGNYFWAQIYDRLQQRAVTLLLPLNYFVDDNFNEVNGDMQTSSCFDETKNVYTLIEQRSDSWINFHDTMYFLNDTNDHFFSFITALEETEYLHLYKCQVSIAQSDLENYSNGVYKGKLKEIKQLTNGDWCVEYNENVRVDEFNRLIYFTAYQNPIESHLFVVSYDEPYKVKQLTPNSFSHKISMDKKYQYFISTCSNLSTQSRTYLFKISNQKAGVDSLQVKQLAQILCREDLKQQQQTTMDVKNIELKSTFGLVSQMLNLNTDCLSSSFDEQSIIPYLFKPPQIFTFQIDDKCKLYGMIYMPFNYEHGKKYPTILYVYAGPKAQIVTNSYKSNRYSRFNLLSILGYCVVVIDSRGSDYRGKNFEAHLNRKMGRVEINDQVKGLQEAAKIFNCIDMKRVGIFGWSYGGYMALMGLAQRPDVFKVAISGAPVTCWTLYDTGYTERYMGLPTEEKEAYVKGSVLNMAKLFPDEENRLLIIHGMIDENVHFVHTRKLIDALIKENKPYQLQIYPNERHGIRSPEASLHCDVNLYSFLERHL